MAFVCTNSMEESSFTSVLEPKWSFAVGRGGGVISLIGAFAIDASRKEHQIALDTY